MTKTPDKNEKDWRDPETRNLLMPDGNMRAVTVIGHYWELYDKLITWHGLNHDRIMDYTLENLRGFNRHPVEGFVQSFQELLVSLERGMSEFHAEYPEIGAMYAPGSDGEPSGPVSQAQIDKINKARPNKD